MALSAGGSLYLLSLSDAKLSELTKAKGIKSIAWTPEGSYLLYVMEGDDENEKDQLWRIHGKGGKPQKLGLAMPDILSLRVHPDGRRIAFRAQAQPEKNEVWVMQNFLPKASEESNPE